MGIIEIKNLTRRFGKNVAVNNISLDIKKGEIFGLLGPNGAGKTTLISMLSTILLPTKGNVKIDGYDLIKDAKEIRKIIGLVFQETILDEELSAYDNLDIHARLYKIPKILRRKRVLELMKLVGLEKVVNDKISTYSGGMKRKVELIKGLVNDPKILFLDEPTLGLDPQTRRFIWNYILELNKKRKMTIILTSHYMDEADVLCDRIGIINYGKFIKLDTPDKLKNLLKGDIIEVKVNKIQRDVLSSVKNLPYVSGVDLFPKHFRIYVKKGEEKIEDIINFFKSKGLKIKSIMLKKPTLEDVFLHLTGKELG